VRIAVPLLPQFPSKSHQRSDLKKLFSPLRESAKKGTQKSNKTLMLYLAICCYFFCTGNERSDGKKADHVAMGGEKEEDESETIL
jgi:hypothetical protein